MGKFTARTIETISAAMEADKLSRAALSGITTTSDTGVWPNLRDSFATAANVHEESFVSFADEVEDRAAEIQTGISRWYAAESLVFQFGDSLQYINGNLVYLVEDLAKQIVKLAAADKENGFLIIKIAAFNPDLTARPLTATELTAFKAYWDDKRFACTPLAFISQSGDIARIQYRVGVDATVIDPATGQLLTDPAVFPVEVAITELLKTFQADRFNSIFRLADLTDTIQAVDGVINPIAEDVQIKPSAGAFIDVINSLNDEYLARAGYIVSDPIAPFRLRDLLNYYDAN